MIDLTGRQPFASGSNRHCFVHPDDPTICLKVIIPENIERRFQRQPLMKKLLGRQRLDDNRQELVGHDQRAIRRLVERGEEARLSQHLPGFFGVVTTTLGPANASELIRQANGFPAPTLEACLQREGRSQALEAAITRFSDWLWGTGILTRNLLPHNLVVTDRSGQPELFLVDGLGAPAVQERLAISTTWRHRYLTRKLRRFQLRIDWELSDRRTSWESAQKL